MEDHLLALTSTRIRSNERKLKEAARRVGA
jgi:hypothetical protein